MQLFSGRDYLRIDIANNFGLDKEDWNVRLDWFNSNEHQLDKLIKQAETPALYYAGIQAWKKTQAGRPTGYPISLDATSSGIQILACLTGDRKAAELCNVVNTGHRQDAYTGLYQKLLDKVGESAKVSRKDTKQAIMTAFYNSTAVPKRVFGEGAILNCFYETMKENAPGAWELNETMLNIWDNTALMNSWVMPDNFHIQIKVMGNVTERVHFLGSPFDVNYSQNMPIENGRSLGANMTHGIDGMVVKEMERRCNFDPVKIEQVRNITRHNYKEAREDNDKNRMVKTLWGHYLDCGFLSTRILDYITPHNAGHVTDMQPIVEMIDSLPKKPFELLSIHDCFRCLPNYGNDLRKQYNICLSNIAKSNLLSFIISQIINRKVTIGKLDDNLWKDILDTEYALS